MANDNISQVFRKTCYFLALTLNFEQLINP